MVPLCRQQYWTQSSLCIPCKINRTMSLPNTGLRCPFLLNNMPNSLPTLLPIMWLKSVLKNAGPDFSFARWMLTFCVFRDTVTAIEDCVIVSLLNELVHGFHNIGIWMVETGFRIKIRGVWGFWVKTHKNTLCNISVQWWVVFFRRCNLSLPIKIQLLRHKFCEGAECVVRKNFRR